MGGRENEVALCWVALLVSFSYPISFPSTNSCLIEVEEELFHIACRQYGREVFVIAMPAAL